MPLLPLKYCFSIPYIYFPNTLPSFRFTVFPVRLGPVMEKNWNMNISTPADDSGVVTSKSSQHRSGRSRRPAEVAVRPSAPVAWKTNVSLNSCPSIQTSTPTVKGQIIRRYVRRDKMRDAGTLQLWLFTLYSVFMVRFLIFRYIVFITICCCHSADNLRNRLNWRMSFIFLYDVHLYI